MANELGAEGLTSGATHYAIIRNVLKQPYYVTGTVFEAYNASHYTGYAIPLTEQGATGNFYGDFPALAAGKYFVDYRLQASGSPAVSDVHKVSDVVVWSGTALVYSSGDAFARIGVNGAGLTGIVIAGYAAGEDPVTLLKADSEIKSVIANVNGQFAFTPPSAYPGAGTVVLKNQAGNTNLLTITLNFDANKNIVSRTTA